MTATNASQSSIEHRPRLGELLVALGVLTEEQLREVLARQRETHEPIGKLLVEGGYALPSTVAMALATQHGGLTQSEYGFATGYDVPSVVDPIDFDGASEPPASPAADTDLRLAEPPAPEAVVVDNVPPAGEPVDLHPTPEPSPDTDLRLAEVVAPEDVPPAVEPVDLEPAPELDLRHAGPSAPEVNLEALARFEADIVALRADLEDERQARAAVEELVAALRAANAELEEMLESERRSRATAEAELEAARAEQVEPPRYATDSHTLFFRSESGYLMLDRPGAAPAVGDRVTIDERSYEVVRLSPAPYPGAATACAYLETAS